MPIRIIRCFVSAMMDDDESCTTSSTVSEQSRVLYASAPSHRSLLRNTRKRVSRVEGSRRYVVVVHVLRSCAGVESREVRRVATFTPKVSTPDIPGRLIADSPYPTTKPPPPDFPDFPIFFFLNRASTERASERRVSSRLGSRRFVMRGSVSQVAATTSVEGGEDKLADLGARTTTPLGHTRREKNNTTHFVPKRGVLLRYYDTCRWEKKTRGFHFICCTLSHCSKHTVRGAQRSHPPVLPPRRLLISFTPRPFTHHSEEGAISRWFPVPLSTSTPSSLSLSFASLVSQTSLLAHETGVRP